MAFDRTRTVRGAVAGAAGALVWAAQQPADKRAFDCAFDDVELLGRAVTRGSAWYPIGLALHLQNGALFGAIYANVAPSVPVPPWARAPLAALLEHLATWPLTRLSDRFHPAREDMPALWGNRTALAQATWRHLVFGAVLGVLERRLNEPDAELPEFEGIVSSNGHGSLEQGVSAERSAS
jgi:hypothetical protein